MLPLINKNILYSQLFFHPDPRTTTKDRYGSSLIDIIENTHFLCLKLQHLTKISDTLLLKTYGAINKTTMKARIAAISRTLMATFNGPINQREANSLTLHPNSDSSEIQRGRLRGAL